MHIIHVLPITRQHIPEDTLSYFSSSRIDVGSIVCVQIRKKDVPALILKTEEAKLKKTEIRKEGFQLKKILSVISPPVLNEKFFEFLNKTSKYFLVPKPILAHFIIPKHLLQKTKDRKLSVFVAEKNNSKKYDKEYIQGTRNERFKNYRSLTREYFAKKKSAMILFPSNLQAKSFYKDLSKGLENKSFLVHNSLSKKKFLDLCAQILSSPEPVLIVGTYSMLSLPRDDWGLLIADNESSDLYYHSRTSPFVDLRKAFEIFAEAHGLHLVFGDIMLRVETITKNSLSAPSGILTDPPKTEISDLSDEKQFKILGKELLGMLGNAQKNMKKTVVISRRKGTYTSTVCKDCGFMLFCEKCSVPLVLRESGIYACNHCEKRYESISKCPRCRGWNLAGYGVGIQLVEKELKKHFPNTPLFRMDRDAVKTEKKGMEIKEDFKNSRNGILVATELFLNFFTDPQPNIAVTTLDGTLSIPDYKSKERLLLFILKIKEMASEKFLIQTRLRSLGLFRDILSGNLEKFVKEETEERKTTGYGPDTLLIKIRKEDTNKERLIKDITSLKKMLDGIAGSKNAVLDYPSFISKIKGRFGWHVLIRLKNSSEEEWPDKYPELIRLLKVLPPSWKVQVEPPSII